LLPAAAPELFMSEIIPICDKRGIMYYLVTYGKLSQVKMA
jgi:hypothetical protein